jgi:hypothetical protein
MNGKKRSTIETAKLMKYICGENIKVAPAIKPAPQNGTWTHSQAHIFRPHPKGGLCTDHWFTGILDDYLMTPGNKYAWTIHTQKLRECGQRNKKRRKNDCLRLGLQTMQDSRAIQLLLDPNIDAKLRDFKSSWAYGNNGFLHHATKHKYKSERTKRKVGKCLQEGDTIRVEFTGQWGNIEGLCVR